MRVPGFRTQDEAAFKNSANSDAILCQAVFGASRKIRRFQRLAISHAICRTKRVFSKLDFLANLACDDFIDFYRQKKFARPGQTLARSKARGQPDKENPRPTPLPGKKAKHEIQKIYKHLNIHRRTKQIINVV